MIASDIDVMLGAADTAAERLRYASRHCDDEILAQELAAAAESTSAAMRRVRVELLRRREQPVRTGDLLGTVTIGDLVVDRAAQTVTLAGAPVALSGREFDLLSLMASDPMRVWPKDVLLREVWGLNAHATSTRTLDSHACRLRGKLGGRPWVGNVWGRGYRLLPAVEVPSAPRPALVAA